MTPQMSKRVVTRTLKWQEHMAANTDDNGVWWSTEPARLRLPESEYMTDASIQHRVEQMQIDGYIERVAKGGYKVTAKRPRPIPTELMRPPTKRG